MIKYNPARTCQNHYFKDTYLVSSTHPKKSHNSSAKHQIPSLLIHLLEASILPLMYRLTTTERERLQFLYLLFKYLVYSECWNFILDFILSIYHVFFCQIRKLIKITSKMSLLLMNFHEWFPWLVLEPLRW